MYDMIRRSWNQNVIGISPSPECATWEELADYLDWESLSALQQAVMVERLRAEFDDETNLLSMTFSKLSALLTPLGLIFAFGGGSTSHNSFSAALFIVSSCVSIIFVVWALSTRFKVLRKPSDSGLAALMVTDGSGKRITDQNAANAWWLYTWKWHRYHTRLAIDRMFLCACLLTSATLCIIMSSVVSWDWLVQIFR